MCFLCFWHLSAVWTFFSCSRRDYAIPSVLAPSNNMILILFFKHRRDVLSVLLKLVVSLSSIFLFTVANYALFFVHVFHGPRYNPLAFLIDTIALALLALLSTISAATVFFAVSAVGLCSALYRSQQRLWQFLFFWLVGYTFEKVVEFCDGAIVHCTYCAW